MRVALMVALLILLFPGCARHSGTIAVQAQDRSEIKKSTVSNTQPNRIVMTETDEYRRLRTDGFNALYNMDYQTARVKFEKMIELVPEHPAAYFYLTTNFLFDQLNSRRRLRINLYSDDSFFAENKEKIDDKTDQEFRRLIALALERAEAALKKNPRDPEALYYQGAVHGLLALYETTVARSFFSALSNGGKSVDLHRKVIEIDPSFTDAYLTIGTYDYVVGSLPFFIKLLAKIGGISGSRERGLEEVQSVAEHGLYANDDARVTLITLYAREHRYEEVLKLLDKLSEKYPHNYLFKLERGNMLIKLGRANESFHIFDQLLKEGSMKRVADLVHYQYGEALAGQRRNQEAIEHFRAVIALPGSSAELVTRSHLRAGQLLDLLKQRNEAVAEYQAVLQRENVFDSHEQAKRYLKRPYLAPSAQD